MKAKQLELFENKPICVPFKIFKVTNWIIFDNVKNRDFKKSKSNNEHYPLVIGMPRLYNSCFFGSKDNCKVYGDDYQNSKLSIEEYLEVANFLKTNGKTYNKKLGKILNSSL